MDAQPAHRANFKSLRQWIIEPAVEDLTKKYGADVSRSRRRKKTTPA
ncbi:hypothetical protein [Paraburkholderia terrae]